MNLGLSIVLALGLTLSAPAADWMKELSPAQPGPFAAPRSGTATYAFGWGALSAAQATLTFSRPNAGRIQLDVNLKTTGAVRGMFRLDVQQTSVAREATLRPISMRESDVYSGETITTKLDFGTDSVVRSRRSTVDSPGNGNPKTLRFKPLFDLQTTLLWIRTQRLQVGDVYRLVIYSSSAPFLAEFTVVKSEPLKVGGQSFKALKVDLTLRRVSKQLEVLPYQHLKRASAWISDDPERLLLKAESEVAVGKVWAEFQKFEPAKK